MRIPSIDDRIPLLNRIAIAVQPNHDIPLHPSSIPMAFKGRNLTVRRFRALVPSPKPLKSRVPFRTSHALHTDPFAVPFHPTSLSR